jgi:phage terminase large subunit GpA-like protein
LELLDDSDVSVEATGMGDGEVEDYIGAVPEFEPATTEEQGDLDGRTSLECPECGHEFHR